MVFLCVQQFTSGDAPCLMMCIATMDDSVKSPVAAMSRRRPNASWARWQSAASWLAVT